MIRPHTEIKLNGVSKQTDEISFLLKKKKEREGIPVFVFGAHQKMCASAYVPSVQTRDFLIGLIRAKLQHHFGVNPSASSLSVVCFCFDVCQTAAIFTWSATLACSPHLLIPPSLILSQLKH